MALEHEIDLLVAQTEAQAKARSGAQRRKLVAFWSRRARTVAAFQRVFVRNGTLSDDAILVLDDLARLARMGFADLAGESEAELRERAAMRRMLLHLLARCDLTGEGLRKINKRLMELKQ